jgi:6-phosphogluconolactonase
MQNVTIIEGGDAAAIAAWLSGRIAAPAAITIPGGSTPFPIIEALINADTVEWSGIKVWPNDDRIVPEDHEASNTGKIRALLEPQGAAVVTLEEGLAPPRFALTWLGMGPDGHTASLFPNTDPRVDDLQMLRRLTPDPLPAHAPFDRITLTLPALLDSDAILFTLGGSAEKRDVFEAAMRGEHDLPIARLLKAAETRDIPVTCFI